MKPRPRRFAALLLFAATAFCVWAFVLNRAISYGDDSPVKTLAALGWSVAVTTAVWIAWRRQQRPLAVAAAVLLGAFMVGEGHRAWLRLSYGAKEGGAQAGSLLRPVTTTDLAVDSYTVTATKLRRDRLRVVQLSDLHITESVADAYFVRVKAQVSALAPDVIVLTGDYVSKVERLGLLQRWLDDFPRATAGIYAVLGNHDYWTHRPELVRAALERAGMRVLSGECAPSAGVRVCGTDAPWGPKLSSATLAEHDDFTLVLSHTPDNIYDVADAGADAMFAGHTHGGQLRLPGLGAVIVPSSYGRRFDRGQFVVGGTSLFVSSGIGADAPALRLWCRPAIVVVDFVHFDRT